MAHVSTNSYQKRFIKQALRYLPHHLSITVATKLHIAFLTKRLDTYAKNKIIGPVSLPAFDRGALEMYEEVTREAALWHGTGRYQYDGGETVDVLEGILKAGSLRPAEDAYIVFSGKQPIRSISLTKLRVIARCYADMHGKGFREPHRYGGALMWTSYYYGLFYARLYSINYPKVRKHYKAWHALTHDERGHNTWGKKVNQQAEDVWDVFGLGSDIENNYPILVGLKQLSELVQLPRFYSDYEVRSAQEIKLKAITHLEVPATKIDEVSQLLKKYHLDIPVLDIEVGELVASRQPFSKLIGLSR